jgi:hypothetical protein
MRLDEITNSNIVWGKLSGVDLESVQTEYHYIISLLKSLIQLGSHYRVISYLHTITLFENELHNLIMIDYTGYPNQSDIKKFNNKCRKMLSNIQYLKSQLP